MAVMTGDISVSVCLYKHTTCTTFINYSLTHTR